MSQVNVYSHHRIRYSHHILTLGPLSTLQRAPDTSKHIKSRHRRQHPFNWPQCRLECARGSAYALAMRARGSHRMQCTCTVPRCHVHSCARACRALFSWPSCRSRARMWVAVVMAAVAEAAAGVRDAAAAAPAAPKRLREAVAAGGGGCCCGRRRMLRRATADAAGDYRCCGMFTDLLRSRAGVRYQKIPWGGCCACCSPQLVQAERSRRQLLTPS